MLIFRNHNNLLVFAITFLSFTIAAPPLFMDADVAWHIAAGDYILQSNAVPYYDPWSYVGSEQRWYNISWLWDIACSILNHLIGFNGLAIVLSIILSSLSTYIYHSLIARSYDLSHDAVTISAALTSLLFVEIGFFRPQLVSCLCIALFCNLLHEFYHKNQAPPFKALTFSMLIWVNTHGGFLLGFVILGIYGINAIQIKQWQKLKLLILMTVICFITTFINPIGHQVYVGTLRTLDSVALNYIYEWRPFFFGQSYSFTMLFFVLIMAGCAFNSHYRQLKISINDWIIGLFFLIGSLISIRNFSNLATSGAPFIAGIIDRVLPPSKYQIQLTNRQKVAASLVLVVISIVINVMLIIQKTDKRLGLSKIPTEVIEYAAEHYPGYTFFNDYNIGGYVILFGQGKFKHFLDGRAGTVFTEERLASFINVLDRKLSFIELAEEQNVDGIIIHDAILKQQKSKALEAWPVVYSANNYSLLISKKWRQSNDK